MSVGMLRTSVAFPCSDRRLTGDTVRVSAHVWTIIGWPNTGGVGQDATLAVDTGQEEAAPLALRR